MLILFRQIEVSNNQVIPKSLIKRLNKGDKPEEDGTITLNLD